MTMQSLSQRKMLDKDTNSAREESAKRILEQKFNWRIKLDKRMKEKEGTTNNNKDNKKSKESNDGSRENSKETKTSDETEPITKKKLPPPPPPRNLGVHTPVDPGSMPYPSSPPPPPPQSTRTKEEAHPNKDATSSEHSPAISSLTHSFHETSLTAKKELPPVPPLDTLDLHNSKEAKAEGLVDGDNVQLCSSEGCTNFSQKGGLCHIHGSLNNGAMPPLPHRRQSPSTPPSLRVPPSRSQTPTPPPSPPRVFLVDEDGIAEVVELDASPQESPDDLDGTVEMEIVKPDDSPQEPPDVVDSPPNVISTAAPAFSESDVAEASVLVTPNESPQEPLDNGDSKPNSSNVASRKSPDSAAEHPSQENSRSRTLTASLTQSSPHEVEDVEMIKVKTEEGGEQLVPKLKRGSYALYQAPQGDLVEAVILDVHQDDLLEPYYTIQLPDGREKQTDNAHLSTSESKSKVCIEQYRQIYLDAFNDASTLTGTVLSDNTEKLSAEEKMKEDVVDEVPSSQKLQNELGHYQPISASKQRQMRVNVPMPSIGESEEVSLKGFQYHPIKKHREFEENESPIPTDVEAAMKQIGNITQEVNLKGFQYHPVTKRHEVRFIGDDPMPSSSNVVASSSKIGGGDDGVTPKSSKRKVTKSSSDTNLQQLATLNEVVGTEKVETTVKPSRRVRKRGDRMSRRASMESQRNHSTECALVPVDSRVLMRRKSISDSNLNNSDPPKLNNSDPPEETAQSKNVHNTNLNNSLVPYRKSDTTGVRPSTRVRKRGGDRMSRRASMEDHRKYSSERALVPADSRVLTRRRSISAGAPKKKSTKYGRSKSNENELISNLSRPDEIVMTTSKPTKQSDETTMTKPSSLEQKYLSLAKVARERRKMYELGRGSVEEKKALLEQEKTLLEKAARERRKEQQQSRSSNASPPSPVEKKISSSSGKKKRDKNLRRQSSGKTGDTFPPNTKKKSRYELKKALSERRRKTSGDVPDSPPQDRKKSFFRKSSKVDNQ